MFRYQEITNFLILIEFSHLKIVLISVVTKMLQFLVNKEINEKYWITCNV